MPEASVTVSMLVGVYRSGPYVDEFLRSVRRQTRTDWELILVDDASPDDVVDRIGPHLDDPRIALVRHEVNRGSAAARNTAAARARGRLLLAIDSDDVLEEDFLERLLGAVADVDDLAVAGCVNRHIDDDGAPVPSSPQPPETDPERFLLRVLRGPFTHGPVTLVTAARFAALGGYDERSVFGEDFALWTRALAAGGRAVVVDDPLYRYRVHAGSTSFDPRHEIGNYENLLVTLDLLEAEVPPTSARRAALAVHRTRTRRLLAEARYRDAVRRGDRTAARTAAGALVVDGPRLRGLAKYAVALLPASVPAGVQRARVAARRRGK